MSIEIVPDGGGHMLHFRWRGTGFKSRKHKANNIAEVHEAIDHHMGSGNKQQEHANGTVENCPLCRHQREQSEKKTPRRPTVASVDRLAAEKGLIFESRPKYDGRTLTQKYEITDNDSGVTAGVLTLDEAVAEINSWHQKTEQK